MVEFLNVRAVGGLAVGALFGGMTFFSFIMAPLIFSKLSSGAAGAFIRQVFPVYYLVMGVLSAFALILVVSTDGTFYSLNGVLLSATVVGFFVARQLLMPRINHHRDRQLAGDRSAATPFKWLHASSVAINIAQIIAAAIILANLIATR